MRKLLLSVALAALAAPGLAQAQQDPLSPTAPPPPPKPEATDDGQSDEAPPPAPVPATVVRVPTDWRGIFATLRAGQWPTAAVAIAAMPDGPLKPVALAELYTAKKSPKVELAPILDLMARAPDLPDGPQLQRMAIARGATALPTLAYARPIVFLGSSPRRQPFQFITAESDAGRLRSAMKPLVDANDALGAEALLSDPNYALTPDARAEAAHRVGWIYYILGDDVNARRVVDAGRVGALGDWAGHAAWLSGLASWRMGDCNAALTAFRETARSATDREVIAAANYWAARSAQSCRRPGEVSAHLKAAARFPDSFYGLVARETLGMPTTIKPLSPDISAAALGRPNVVRARELLAIGERALADEHLRFQARIGPMSEHQDLVRIAGRLGLYATQYWLAHNGPQGVTVDPAARFPYPPYAPAAGWRIDPALALAHTRQESEFRTAIISPAGAVGLMQVRPGTANDIARSRGTSIGTTGLTDPSANLEYGQSYIEQLRRSGSTQGQLLKIMASYNSGPGPLARWNLINDKGDPLLWMESLSYWETRLYIPAVLRNLFVYQGLERREQSQLKALAEHRWPTFPTK